MNLKALIATAAIAVSGAVATSAVAAPLASTQVTIKGNNGDYYGYVKSTDQNHCEGGRKVTVFKMLGASPSPKTDQKIGDDIAQPNGPDAMWSIGNSGYKHGHFYARVRATDYCQADLSPVIDR
jgi:uncharacterized membrane protein